MFKQKITVTSSFVFSAIPPEKTCTGLGQCVLNAECESPLGGLCKCDEGFYEDADKCLPRKTPGTSCTDSEQCVAHSVCHVNASQCTCNAGFYSEPDSCQPLKPADETCTDVGQLQKLSSVGLFSGSASLADSLDDPISCHGKPVKPTNEIKGCGSSLVRSTGFP